MGRRSRRAQRERRAPGLTQLPFRRLENRYPPFEILSADEIESIHLASLRVLRDIGINFLLPEACDILAAAGADVDGTRVRFDPALIEEKIALAPAGFTLHARNPERNVYMGGDSLVFAVVGSAPNVSDLDGGRRTGNFEDYCNLIRLGHSLNIAHLIAGYPVEPVDLDPRTRHLDAVAAMAHLSDKVLYGYALGRTRMEDAVEMVRIARGVDHDTLRREPSMETVVNANSPLQYDVPMLEGAIVMARAGQPVIWTPFTLAGAMAPITVAGALVQQNAEALAGIAFAQCVNPGAPAIYGSFTSNVDMKSGSPAFGTPEYVKATLVSGQLARRYRLPLRASNATASNAPDAQAVYESEMSSWACVLAHVNLVKHGLGWLEGGLCASYEKFILDAEILQMLAAFLDPLETDEDALAVSAIAEVGPGKHYFQAAHTMARYQNAFYAPLLSDWRNFDAWREAGALDATHRANAVWKQLLAEYEQPVLNPGRAEELDAFVAKRKEEGGAPPL